MASNFNYHLLFTYIFKLIYFYSNNNAFGMAVMELGNAGYKKHDPHSSKDIDTIINKLTKRFHMARYDIIRDIVAA